MTNASGIDAEGPWFDGVEVLKEKEIGPVSVKQAKAKSMFYVGPTCEHNADRLYAEIAIVGAGMAGLMTFVGRTAVILVRA